jgi:hypothetical protein
MNGMSIAAFVGPVNKKVAPYASFATQNATIVLRESSAEVHRRAIRIAPKAIAF